MIRSCLTVDIDASRAKLPLVSNRFVCLVEAALAKGSFPAGTIGKSKIRRALQLKRELNHHHGWR